MQYHKDGVDRTPEWKARAQRLERAHRRELYRTVLWLHALVLALLVLGATVWVLYG
jgi:hypothetical protein